MRSLFFVIFTSLIIERRYMDMNEKTIIKIGVGLLAASFGWIIGQRQYSKELEDILEVRTALFESQQALLDEALSTYQKNIETRDEVIRLQTEVIAKFDPSLAEKLGKVEPVSKSLMRNLRLVKG